MNSILLNKGSKDAGNEIYSLIERLYPICRSITGNGVRETLKIIEEDVPLETYEIPSGSRVFDWEVPNEWRINDAYIKNSRGDKVVDFKVSNLHVLNYSAPIRKKLSLRDLKELLGKNVFTLPDHPDRIPYVTSYYNEKWGFCLSHNQFSSLPDDDYELFIDSSFYRGSLTYGEYYLKGSSEKEILISCYTCHPSLCNDNLSGVALTARLARQIKSKKTKYSYRFLFIPETIGAIAWLSLNENKIKNIRHGLIVTCVGDPGNLTYKKSRSGNAEIDRTVLQVLRDYGDKFELVDFFPSGSDERQFSSPAFDLPVGSLMRTMYGKFPEYHNSADDLDFVKPECLADTFAKYLSVLDVLEINFDKSVRYMSLNPKGEPQLGKRQLYHTLGGQEKGNKILELARAWVLNFSDGRHSLLDIVDRSGIVFEHIKQAADELCSAKLLEKLD